MIRTDGRPTIVWSDLAAWESAPSNTASAFLDPASTADCDGYPALAAPKPETCCGDPGDCATCGR